MGRDDQTPPTMFPQTVLHLPPPSRCFTRVFPTVFIMGVLPWCSGVVSQGVFVNYLVRGVLGDVFHPFAGY